MLLLYRNVETSKTFQIRRPHEGDELQIAANLRETQEQFYRDVVARNPAMSKDLKGWLCRAQSVYPDLPA